MFWCCVLFDVALPPPPQAQHQKSAPATANNKHAPPTATQKKTGFPPPPPRGDITAKRHYPATRDLIHYVPTLWYICVNSITASQQSVQPSVSCLSQTPTSTVFCHLHLPGLCRRRPVQSRVWRAPFMLFQVIPNTCWCLRGSGGGNVGTVIGRLKEDYHRNPLLPHSPLSKSENSDCAGSWPFISGSLGLPIAFGGPCLPQTDSNSQKPIHPHCLFHSLDPTLPSPLDSSFHFLSIPPITLRTTPQSYEPLAPKP